MRQPALDHFSEEAGFTLMELLIAMIIMGVLTSVAIPIFLAQRAKAHDASTKADVSTVGKEVATYFVDGTNALSLDFNAVPGSVVLTDGGSYWSTVNLTNGTARPTSGYAANLDDPFAWCVALTDPKGYRKEFHFSAQSGLGVGTC